VVKWSQEHISLSEQLSLKKLRGLENTKLVNNFSIYTQKTWGAVRYIIWYKYNMN